MISQRNIRTRIDWALRCPTYYLLRLVSKPGSSPELRFHLKRRCTSLSALLNVPVSMIESYLTEIEYSQNLQRAENTMRGVSYSGVFRGGPELYVIARAKGPRIVVETGVGIGYSSVYVLEALDQNNMGRLVSIDLPNADPNWSLPNGTPPGLLVPEDLRFRWDLHLGDTHRLLPRVLQELTHVDLFLHDSKHTYETMMFEYNQAFDFLSDDGLLISDDAMWNMAMIDFARKKNRRIEFVYHRGGSAPFTVIRRAGLVP